MIASYLRLVQNIMWELRSSNFIFNLFKKLAYEDHFKYPNKIKRLASQVCNS